MLKKHRILLIILALVMGLSVLPASAAEDSEEKIDNGIPVISLTIDPAEYQSVISSEDHSYRAEGCSIRIDVPDGFTSEFGAGDTSIIGRDLALEYFRGRGNATWLEEKKPFRLKLEEAADLFGMGENKNWVLLANVKDGALMRNLLVSYMGRELGLEYTPEFVPVDFVVNGEYMGSYLLGTNVKIGKNRVELDEVDGTTTAEPEITGGYLIALEPYPDEPEVKVITTKSGARFMIDEPDISEYGDDEQEAQQAQRAYVEQYLQQTEDAIYADDFTVDGVRYTELMDIESAAKYWWIQEFTCNDDGFRTDSTYLYKERDGKLYWGPLWDFDMAFWPVGANGSLTFCPMPWLDHLRGYEPEYQQVLRETWDKFDAVLQEITREGGVMDQYRDLMSASWAKNKERWPEYMPGNSYDETVDELRETIDLRRKAIAESVDTNLTNVFAHVTFIVEGEEVETKEIYVGRYLNEEDFPQVPEKEGYYFLNWADENGEPFKAFTEVSADMTLTAQYVSEAEAIMPEAVYFDMYEQWTDLEYSFFYPNVTVVPEDAVDKTLTWSVSDPSLAEIDGDAIYFLAAGDVTITATTINGVSASMTLHICEKMKAKELKKIDFESDTLTLKPGGYGQLRFTLTPEGEPLMPSFMFESTDEEVATVDVTGVVHAVAEGTCEINIYDFESNRTAKYTVVVSETAEPATEEQTAEGADASTEAAETEDAQTSEASAETTAPTETAAPEEQKEGGSYTWLIILIAAVAAAAVAAVIIVKKKGSRKS